MAGKKFDEFPESTTLEDSDIFLIQPKQGINRKISWSSLKPLIGKINALEYGFDNTGQLANDSVMKKYISQDADMPIWFPSGTYIFNESIVFKDEVYVDCDSDCIWRLEKDISLPFIQFTRTKWNVNRNCYFKNAYVDVNFHANTGIGFIGVKYFECCPKVVSNFKLYGVETGYGKFNDESCGGLWFHHCLFVNDTYVSNTVAIYDNASDNRFSDIIIRDITQGIYAASGRYTNIHHWVMHDAENSLFAHVIGDNALFTNIYADTLHSIFDADNWRFVNAQGISVYYNTDYYPDSLFASNPPVLFKNVEKVTYNISNLTFRVYHDCYFGDSGDYNPYSNFSNIVMYNQSNTTDIKNLPENVKDHRVLDGSFNFDTAVNAGTFNVNTYEGTGGNNVPSNMYGLMYVLASNAAIVQLIFGNSKITTRKRQGSVWGDWTDFVPPKQINTEKLDGSSDYDNFLDEDTRYEVNTYSGSGGNNAPQNAFGLMKVLNCGDYMIAQTIYCRTKIIQRLYASGTWSVWVEITTTS